MSVLYIALPLALLLGAAGLMACIYCVRSGQYDDLESPPCRMLIEETPRREPPVAKHQSPCTGGSRTEGSSAGAQAQAMTPGSVPKAPSL